MREMFAAHRRSILIALLIIGVVNVSLIVRPWARDSAPVTDIAVAASAPAGATVTGSGAQPWVSLAKTQMLGEEESRSFKSATLFVSYFLISTRAMGEHCGALGHDFTDVGRVFAATHDAEYRKASEILANLGLNADFIWMFFEAKLQGLAASQLDQLAAFEPTDRAGICAKIVADPQRFAVSRGYARNHPDLRASLMQ